MTTDSTHSEESFTQHAKVLVRHLSGSDKWGTYTEDAEVFVQQFPKIELHVHLDGAFDPDVLWQYLQENKPTSMLKLPTSTVLPWEAPDSPQRVLPVQQLVQECQSHRDYHQLCSCRGYRSLKQMLKCFEIFLPTVRQNLVLLEKLAYDFCQRQWQQNVVYTEVRYSPFLLAEGYGEDPNDSSPSQNPVDPNHTITGRQVFDCITRGLRKGCQHFGIVVNQILCCITWRPDWAQDTLELVQEFQNDFPCATVGIDIASGEEHFDQQAFPDLYQPHYDVMQKAKATGVPITLHAGEVPSVKALDNLRRAVNEYGATRIGHGYRVAQSPETMVEMKDRGIHFEVCPTSSVETGGWMYDDPNAFIDGTQDLSNQDGDQVTDQSVSHSKRQHKRKKDWRKHPCRTMQSHGLALSLNSDDPAVFHTSLAWQYRTALVKMGMSRYELVQSNLDAIDAAFCSTSTKQKLRKKVQLYAQQTGVIDQDGQRVLQSDDEAEAQPGYHSQESSDSTSVPLDHPLRHNRAYRRSVSEHFKDRVYLETNVAVAIDDDTVLAQQETIEIVNYYS